MAVTGALQRVLAEPCCWSVQTAALLLRSRWEKDNARRLQRSLSQLEVSLLHAVVCVENNYKRLLLGLH